MTNTDTARPNLVGIRLAPTSSRVALGLACAGWLVLPCAWVGMALAMGQTDKAATAAKAIGTLATVVWAVGLLVVLAH